MSSPFGGRRNNIALGIVIAYAVINFLLNMFVVGGSDFISDLNTVIPLLWGTLAILMLVRLLSHERDNAVTTRIYRWLLLGLGLWVLADIIWAFYVFALRIEVPYPSWADLFWIAGYVPIFHGLYRRIRSYGVPLRTRDRWLLLAILGVLLIPVIESVLLPMVGDYDPRRLAESVLNLAYPLFDTTLLIMTLIILFTLERGRFAPPWAVITISFVFNAAADLMFYRALWMGTYYPEGRATFLSVLIDGVYNLLYPTLCLGFYMADDLVSERAMISDHLATQRTPDTRKVDFEIYTDAQNRIISVSENLLYFLGVGYRSKIVGAPLDKALGTGKDEMQDALRSLQERGYVRELQLSVTDTSGQQSDVWLTGFPRWDPRGGFSGANFVLQAWLDASFVVPALTKESRTFIDSTLQQAGLLEKERREARARALRTRFQAQMELLYELISSESNRRIARTMEAACQKLASEWGWPIRFGEGKTAVLPSGDPAALEEPYLQILATARAHAVRVLGEELVRAELAKLDKGSPGLIEI